VAAPVVLVSVSSCDDLGWNNAELAGDTLVCSESDADPLPGCSDLLTWSDAKDFCENAGARLCTGIEIENRDAWLSGCGYDTEFLWSSTMCDSGYSVGTGSGDETACLAATDTTYVRCCADVVETIGDDITVVPEPTQAPVVVPMSSVSSCDDLGWNNAEDYGDSLVCAESDAEPFGGCSGDVSWSDGKAFCENVGARLCTVTELLNLETRGTGCRLDNSPIWSSTECAGGYSVATGKGAEEACSAATDLVGTRCCADVTTVSSVSMSSCDDLGWTNAEAYGDSLVCGGSDEGLGGECSGALTWSDGKTFCESAGARLCTATELLNLETRGTGCSLDAQLLWSSTECAGGYSVLTGKGEEAACLAATDTLDTRCCADV